ncbi:MAG: ABC transporter permease [Steroidobacteraceae bacterium]
MLKRTLYGLGVTVAVIGGVVLTVALPWRLIGALLVLLGLWLVLTRLGRLTASVTLSGIATLPQRWGSASVVIVGIAGVVGVLVALLAMASGYQATFQATGSADRAIVLRSGAISESSSNLDQASVMLIGQKPQVAHDATGAPLISPEVVVAASLTKKGSGRYGSATIRGVGAEVWAVRSEVKLIAGRRFTPGLRELDAGRNAVREFQHTSIGSSVTINGQPWKVVGEFAHAGAHDSELWGDVNMVATAFHRGASVQSATVRLTSAKAIGAFKAALASDPRLKVQAQTTRAYYAKQSKSMTRVIRVLATVVGAIMAIGAMAGALNSMYAAVAARTREVATLRAIGFRGGVVVFSILAETLLLALGGGIVGALIAWTLFHHFTASTMGPNFSAVVFRFRVTPTLIGQGLKWALAIGFVGGLFPALRAARMPVTDGLREQ